MTTEEKLAKLPVWAQRHIANLGRDVQFWKDRCTRSEAGETRIWITTTFDAKGETRQYLPDDTVSFGVGPDERDVIDVRHDRLGGDGHELYVMARNTNLLSITPWSGNVCKIRLRET